MSTRTRTLLALLVLVSLLLTPALSASAAGTDGNAAWDVKFSGVITVVGTDTTAWTIGGQAVKTDANTKVLLTEDTAAASGMWANVMAKKVEGGLLASKIAVVPAEMRLVGPVDVMPEGKLGEWTVSGVTFTVDDKTKFSEREEAIALGSWVEVRATEAAGKLTAVAILALEEQEDIELYGAIQAFSDTTWTVSAVPFAVNADTRIMGGKPAEGLLAKVSLKQQEDKTLLARTIKVAWDEQGGWRMPVQFTGKIEALPTGGLVGDWTVAGKKVNVSEQTKVMQKKALAEVGATVHVVGWTQGDTVKAIVVSVVAAPEGAKPFQLIGVIEKLPETGLVGLWTVSGNTIVVTDATRIAGEQYVKVGAKVTVVGTQKADDTKTATLIHAKMGRSSGDGE